MKESRKIATIPSCLFDKIQFSDQKSCRKRREMTKEKTHVANLKKT